MSRPTAEGLSMTDAEIAAHDDQRDVGESGWSSLHALYRDELDGVVLDAGGGSGIYASSLVAAEWRRAIGECARVVRPGGTVLLALGGSNRPGAELREITARIENEIGGAETITLRQAGGLNSPEDADHAFAVAGMGLTAVRRIESVQRRTLGQLIDRTLLNPCRSTASCAVRTHAAGGIKRWVRDRFGSLERVIEVPVGIEYRIYRSNPA